MQCQLHTGTANTLVINYKLTEKQVKSIIFTKKIAAITTHIFLIGILCNLLESFEINLDKCM